MTMQSTQRPLAPVLVGTYTRLAHLQQTIAALRRNSLAAETDLHVYSDAPRPGDEDKVAAVRAFAHQITGFRSVRVVERRSNGRVANVRGGYVELLERFGRAILLEDDVVTAPGFLAFMNAALTAYADQDQVITVSGYLPPVEIASDYPWDCVALPRHIGWGAGSWDSSRKMLEPISPKDYSDLLDSPSLLERVSSIQGRDLLRRYRAEANGHLDSGDTRTSFHALLNRKVCVCPRHSLTRSIGHDGSGLHAAITDKFAVTLWDKTGDFRLDPHPSLQPDIVEKQQRFFADGRDDMSVEVIDNIIAQIEARGWDAFSVWGIDTMTDLFLHRIGARYRIEHVIDSWAQADTRYQNHVVITPGEALGRGERRIVILSFASRHAMRQQLRELAPDCEAVMYTDSVGDA